jgi:precorrin-8X/cobalt-precorrin-8 methylmutase
MPLFDRYIAADWSAANSPKRGKDSIWIGELGPEGRVPSENPPTRHQAMQHITARLVAARERHERIMLGFDFVFGYPRGAARAISTAISDLAHARAGTSPLVGEVGRGGGEPGWKRLWSTFHSLVLDGADNTSNRFHLAEAINLRLADGPHFWGHPHQHSYPGLTPKRPATAYVTIPERRLAERYVRSAQPVWKLTGVGSVGSQAMLGIARLAALHADPRLATDIAVWPFETAFADDLTKPITITEIYPSLFPVTDADGLPRDRAQVEVTTTRFAELDRAGRLATILSPPPGLSAAEREILIAEEGWIAGAGHEALLAELQAAA